MILVSYASKVKRRVLVDELSSMFVIFNTCRPQPSLKDTPLIYLARLDSFGLTRHGLVIVSNQRPDKQAREGKGNFGTGSRRKGDFGTGSGAGKS